MFCNALNGALLMFSGLWWEPSCAAPKFWAKSWPRSAPSTPRWILARPSFTSTRRTFESHAPPGNQDPRGAWRFLDSYHWRHSRPDHDYEKRLTVTEFKVGPGATDTIEPTQHTQSRYHLQPTSNLEPLSVSCCVRFCLSKEMTSPLCVLLENNNNRTVQLCLACQA